MARVTAAITMAFLFATSAGAQEPVVEWTFDDDTGTWQSVDGNAQLTVTADENIVREEGNPVGEYSYTTAGGTFTGVMTELEMGPAGANSLHFWLRTSDPTIMLVSMSEADGSNYMAGFYSLPERWQEVALGFDEFKLDDDSTDENGKLDGDQIAGLGLIDATGFLQQLAAEVPFIDLPELGPRMLWLDDVYLDAEAIAPRWEEVDIDGARAVRLDSFESTPLQWMLIAGDNAEMAYDEDFHADGDFSLRIAFNLAPGKLIGLMTGPGGAPIGTATKLRISLLVESAATILVGLKEADESEYRVMLQLPAGEDLVESEWLIAEFALGDDSLDENGKLDLDQVTEFSIVEASAMMGEAAGQNTLWIDDVLFID